LFHPQQSPGGTCRNKVVIRYRWRGGVIFLSVFDIRWYNNIIQLLDKQEFDEVSDVEELILAVPSIEYGDQIFAYRQEFLDNQERLIGTASLVKFENPLEWLNWIAKTASKETCPSDMVPVSVFLCIRVLDNRVVGMVNIRHFLNDYHLQYNGHIGYSIRKTERRKGYAKEQLRLALLECKRLGISNVLITCKKTMKVPEKQFFQAKAFWKMRYSTRKAM
jgi:predicted acetyltransferase